MFLTRTFLIIFLAYNISHSYAQQTCNIVDQESIQVENGRTSEFDFWQSFRPEVTGKLNSFDLYLTNYAVPDSTLFILYKGEGTSGDSLYAQYISSLTPEWVNFSINCQAVLYQDSIYSLFFDAPANSTADPLIDRIDVVFSFTADMYHRGKYEHGPNRDILFRTYMDTCNIPTDIKQIRSDTWSIFPNPSFDIIRIEGGRNLNWELFDMMSRKIDAGGSDIIELGNRKKGYYILKITDNQNITEFHRVIKN